MNALSEIHKKFYRQTCSSVDLNTPTTNRTYVTMMAVVVHGEVVCVAPGPSKAAVEQRRLPEIDAEAKPPISHLEANVWSRGRHRRKDSGTNGPIHSGDRYVCTRVFLRCTSYKLERSRLRSKQKEVTLVLLIVLYLGVIYEKCL